MKLYAYRNKDTIIFGTNEYRDQVSMNNRAPEFDITYPDTEKNKSKNVLYIYPESGSGPNAFTANVYTCWAGAGKCIRAIECNEDEIVISRKNIEVMIREINFHPSHIDTICTLLGLPEVKND